MNSVWVLLNHALSLLAPAVFLSGFLALAGRFLLGQYPVVGWKKHWLRLSVVGTTVTLCCLIMWGSEGKIASYFLLSTSLALAQWWWAPASKK